MARRLGSTEREAVRGLIEQWRVSGKSAAAFAHEQGIGRHKFQYWRGRFGATRKRTAKISKAASFAPVRLIGELAGGGRHGLEIALAGGDVVRVADQISLDRLRGVVSILRERC
jgi:hypothetical protein